MNWIAFSIAFAGIAGFFSISWLVEEDHPWLAVLVFATLVAALFGFAVGLSAHHG